MGFVDVLLLILIVLNLLGITSISWWLIFGIFIVEWIINIIILVSFSKKFNKF